MSVVDGYTDARGNDRLTGRPHQLEFAHTTVTFEYGPAGVIGRIDSHDKPRRTYVGPLADETVEALTEVARE